MRVSLAHAYLLICMFGIITYIISLREAHFKGVYAPSGGNVDKHTSIVIILYIYVVGTYA